MSDGTPTLQILPERPLADERLSVRVTGLRGGQRIEVTATADDAEGRRWRSSASFIAGRSGVVDLARQAPLWGDYGQADAMGLFTSMRCARPDVGFADPVATPGVTSLDVRAGGVSIAAARVERAALGPGVERIEVRDEGLAGALFVPGRGPAPGVLVLADPAAGVPERTAALLASHGFTALALGYARSRHMAGVADAPLEYVDRAMAWLLARRGVATSRLAVLGTGRGGELARLLAARFPAVGAVCAPETDERFTPPFRPGADGAAAARAERTWRRMLRSLSDAAPSL